MTLNDVLTKQNVITKVILKDGDKELPKELKVKIMRIRMAYNKIKKQFPDLTYVMIPRKYNAKDISDFYKLYGRYKTLEFIKERILYFKNYE